MLRRTCSSRGAKGVPLKVLVSCLRNFSCSRDRVTIDCSRYSGTTICMLMVAPKYLEQSIDTLTREQEKFRKQLTNTFSGTPFAPLEEHVRRNMELFQQTFSMFKPFVPPRAGAVATTESEKASEPATEDDNIDDLRQQMKDMQDRLERLSKEPKKDE